MPCCGGNKSDEETSDGFGGKTRKCETYDNENLNFIWHPTIKNAKKICYVRQLERRYERLQWAYFNLSAELARLQACLRQIVQGDSCERAKLIEDIKRKGIKNVDCDIYPTLEQHNIEMGSLHRKQNMLMACLRQRIGSFQKATEQLQNEDELLSKKTKSQNSLMSATSIKKSQSKTSKAKETSSMKITTYADNIQAEAPSTSPENIKTEKAKKSNKQKKKKAKLSVEVATATKMEEAQKASSSGNLNKKLHKAKSSDLVAHKTAKSNETMSSAQSIISTRSASFKELKAKYQKRPDAAK